MECPPQFKSLGLQVLIYSSLTHSKYLHSTFHDCSNIEKDFMFPQGKKIHSWSVYGEVAKSSKALAPDLKTDIESKDPKYTKNSHQMVPK